MSQQDLFKALLKDPLEADNAPIFDVEAELKVVIKGQMRSIGMSREQVVDKLNLTLRDTDRKPVTYQSFNKWLADSQANTIPAWAIPGICFAIASAAPMAVLAKTIGRKLADNRDSVLMERAELEARRLKLELEQQEQDKVFNQIVAGGYLSE